MYVLGRGIYVLGRGCTSSGAIPFGRNFVHTTVSASERSWRGAGRTCWAAPVRLLGPDNQEWIDPLLDLFAAHLLGPDNQDLSWTSSWLWTNEPQSRIWLSLGRQGRDSGARSRAWARQPLLGLDDRIRFCRWALCGAGVDWACGARGLLQQCGDRLGASGTGEQVALAFVAGQTAQRF
jgi:hypothetical protein